jgi:hypothetical protein
MLRAARIIGHGVDVRWPGAATPVIDSVDSALPWIDRGTEFVQEHLANTRSAGRLEALVLDVDGAMCSWIAGLGSDHQAVAAAARLGSTSDHLADAPGAESASVTPVTFFAGDAVDSTIQPLGQAADDIPTAPDAGEGGGVAILSRLKKKGSKATHVATGRRGILAACDLPGRLFVDALDRRGVEVGRAITLWHALAQAWDPSSKLSPSGAGAAGLTSANACAVLLIDVGTEANGEDKDAAPPRLVWAWSRRGELLAGGSMRLAHVRGESASEITLGKEEASRLAAEWLAWSMQLGISPRRVVCVFPESTRENDSARAFGTALGAAWNGAMIDAVVTRDPIGDTLERLALALESTSEKLIETTPGAALVELSSRPGGAHRSMYKWLAFAVLAAAGVMGVVAWQAQRSAERINESSKVWYDKGLDAAKQALGSAPIDPMQVLRDEVRLRERELIPPSRVVPAKPVLEELETISMVISHEDLTLESIDLSSANLVRVTITAEKIETLEAVTNALRQISNSRVNRWEADYKEFNDPRNGKAVRATLSATWQETGAKSE